jgi:hypothetical protein
MATTAPAGAPGAVTANRAELIAIADSVAREKADRPRHRHRGDGRRDPARARARYGAENDIRAKLDPTPATSACGASSRWSSRSTIISSR